MARACAWIYAECPEGDHDRRCNLSQRAGNHINDRSGRLSSFGDLIDKNIYYWWDRFFLWILNSGCIWLALPLVDDALSTAL